MPRRLLLAALLAPSARAADIVAVAPAAPMPPYQEALQGVCDALGACPPVLTAANGLVLPADARVVIALGGRAARLRYPARATLVTALTPGFDARAGEGDGPVVRVRLTYAPDEFVRRLKAAKPEARRALLLWSRPASGRFARAAAAAATPLGLTAIPVEVADFGDVPALLRSLPDADALWLAPDPGLVTPTLFDAAREIARGRGMTFFAPAPGLAERGADPALAPAFRAAGLAAGAAAREALAGLPAADEAYPRDFPDEARSLLVSSRTRVAPSR